MSNPTQVPEFPPGLRLRNPQTGASFEVIEHTYAVRLRNLRTDAVSAIPQDMAREFERLPAELPEPPRAELPSEQAALSVRPCARNIHAALKRANLTVKGVRVTTGRQRCRVDLTTTLDEYGPERAQEAENVIRRLWNDHEARILVVKAERLYWTLFISVAGYRRTAPADVIDLCHAAALREDEGRTPAPVVASAERLVDIRARHRREDAARFEAALREGMVAVVRTVEALAPALLQFARNASAAAAGLAEAFGVPHPNACALCGQGEGPRDHWSSHDYRPPVDVIRLRRMQLRRTAGYSARERVRKAHQEHRAALAVQRMRAEVRTDRRTELERAGLTEVPFDRQRVQPDASAFALPS